MPEPISDKTLAAMRMMVDDRRVPWYVGPSTLAGLLARLDAAEAERDRLRARVGALEAAGRRLLDRREQADVGEDYTDAFDDLDAALAPAE